MNGLRVVGWMDIWILSNIMLDAHIFYLVTSTSTAPFKVQKSVKYIVAYKLDTRAKPFYLLQKAHSVSLLDGSNHNQFLISSLE